MYPHRVSNATPSREIQVGLNSRLPYSRDEPGGCRKHHENARRNWIVNYEALNPQTCSMHFKRC